ncbi:MAG TPA: hypothetical protein VHR66_09045 [Gemmataceae bacterium]|nr:hypothetical protein [Gemmataceae bacterium]
MPRGALLGVYPPVTAEASVWASDGVNAPVRLDASEANSPVWPPTDAWADLIDVSFRRSSDYRQLRAVRRQV